MREPQAPSLEEILAEFTRVSKPKPGGRTITEWSEHWKVCLPTARRIVHYALTTKRMTTTPTYRADVGRPGRRVLVYLHSFVPKKKK